MNLGLRQLWTNSPDDESFLAVDGTGHHKGRLETPDGYAAACLA